MTSTDISVRREYTADQLKFIQNTEMIPKQYRGNLPAIMACVLTGREIGLGDMHALRAIHIVDGKATMSAELMLALARQRGHSISGESTNERAMVVGKRGDNGDTMTVEWTMEDAQRAGLASKQNWQKYPKAMLWSRAVSQLCRMLFPDIFLGLAYTGEEMGDDGVTVQVVQDATAVVGEPDTDDEPVEAEVVDTESETDFDEDLFATLEVPR